MSQNKLNIIRVNKLIPSSSLLKYSTKVVFDNKSKITKTVLI